MLSAGLVYSQTLKKSMTFQVNTNDLETLKLIVNDYNQRLVRTNIEYKTITNSVVVTNTVTTIVPMVKDGKTNIVEQPLRVLATNVDLQTITNVVVVTNGVWYTNAEHFYVDRILPLVGKYHDELIRVTIRDYKAKK